MQKRQYTKLYFKKKKSIQNNTKNNKTISEIKPDNKNTLHQNYYYKDTNDKKKYDYHVTGSDENGKKVEGIFNLEGEIGIGVLTETDGTEIEIVSDQIESNELIATDINGYKYSLKLD